MMKLLNHIHCDFLVSVLEVVHHGDFGIDNLHG